MFLGPGKGYATSRVYPAVRKYYILFFKTVLMPSELRVRIGQKSLVGGKGGRSVMKKGRRGMGSWLNGEMGTRSVLGEGKGTVQMMSEGDGRREWAGAAGAK